MPAKVEHWANHREPVASGQGRERHRGSSDRRIGPHAISLRLWRGGVSGASAAAPGAAEAHAQRAQVRGHREATQLMKETDHGILDLDMVRNFGACASSSQHNHSCFDRPATFEFPKRTRLSVIFYIGGCIMKPALVFALLFAAFATCKAYSENITAVPVKPVPVTPVIPKPHKIFPPAEYDHYYEGDLTIRKPWRFLGGYA